MSTSPRRHGQRPPSPDVAGAALLDSLVPAMLDEILSRLPVRDAARTSVLSRAWRRRWVSVPYPVLHWPWGTPSAAIDAVLAHRTFPVREFRHHYVPEPDLRRSDLWLLRLASVGVQSLSLKFQWSEPSTVPQIRMLHYYIFSCRELAVLDLEGCDLPGPPPGFPGFPRLTSLSLSDVGFPQGIEGLEALISSSSSLRTLRLEDLRMPDESEQWVIHAPNLQHLVIIALHDYGWRIHDLPSLEVADIDCAGYSGDRNFGNLFSGFDQARILRLNMLDPIDNAPEGPSRSFVNLKNLSLHIPFCWLPSILSVFYLLRKTPKLEILEIEFEHDEGLLDNEDYEEIDMNVLNAHQADDVFSSLTNVHMKNVIWDPCEMLFIKFVLYEARQLEVLSIHQSSLRADEEALAEVARYRRTSPGANLVIRRMPQNYFWEFVICRLL